MLLRTFKGIYKCTNIWIVTAFLPDWADFPWSATDGNTLSSLKNVKKGKLLSIDVNHKHKSLFMKL